MSVLKKIKEEKFYYLIIITIFILDRITKIWISKKIGFYQSKEIVKGILNLTHIHNRGAVFGFFGQSDSPYVSFILTILSLSALLIIIYYFFKIPSEEKTLKLSFSLILGGAFGNLIDRFTQGYVIDFIDFHIKKYHWPAFNVADSSISIGALLLIFIFILRKPKCTLCS